MQGKSASVRVGRRGGRPYNSLMRILIACPAPPRSRRGNRVTAERWAGLLRQLGHDVRIVESYSGQPCDALLALHARKSFPAIWGYRRDCPAGPLIVALTGTDLYRDLKRSRRAQQSLELADRIVVLQPEAAAALAPHLRRKTRVLLQSARPLRGSPAKSRDAFDVCVLGHLRQEKDPFRTYQAVRLLPAASRIRVIHAGAALNPAMARRARSAMAREPRYHWLGELSGPEARRLLARSHLLVVSSRMEGGANVVSEAIVAGVPVVASRIAGNVGMLGADYPGLYPTGDTRALARMLHRAESDATFYARLKKWCARLAPLFQPAREREAWRALLAEISALTGEVSCPSGPSAGTTRASRATATGC